MRRRFASASIRQKLVVLMTLSTTVALLVAATAFASYEVVTYRRTLEQKLETVADVIARNSTAAITFRDPAVAKDVLGGLEAEPAAEAGVIFDAAARQLATFTRAGAEPPPTAPGPIGTRLEWRHIVLARPIVLDGEQVGTVHIVAGLEQLYTRVLVMIGVMLAIVTGCSLLALVGAAFLQRHISRPILELAETARRVTSESNFSLRAPAAGGDEVGRLVDDFNRMLGEIEGQDRQLREQQEQLTVEVHNRTRELVSANAELEASMKRVAHYAEQIAQLTGLAQLLQSCLTHQEIYGVVQDAMPKLFPGASGALTILKASGNVMETAVFWGPRPPEQRVFGPDECWAFRRGRPQIIADPASPLRCAHATAMDGPVTFCLPMLAQGDTVGVLQLLLSAEPEPDLLETSGVANSTRARLAVALCEHIALALANVRLRDALRNQSIVDALTGLYNRRYLENVLERECRRAVRAGRPLSVLVIDIDHFKRFNDTWGHDGGDAVLKKFAELLRTSFRGEDIACRYGGEEFVVLLPETTFDEAFARAEELRLHVHQVSVEHRQQPMGAIAISIGVASLPDHGVEPHELVAAGDRALYEAKATGRDRTVRALAVPQTPAESPILS